MKIIAIIIAIKFKGLLFFSSSLSQSAISYFMQFYIKGNGCMYVGQSSRKPKLRFDQHKEGYKSNKYAKVYGERLRPDLYEKYNPIPTRRDAEEIEKMLGEYLRKKGLGVWYN